MPSQAKAFERSSWHRALADLTSGLSAGRVAATSLTTQPSAGTLMARRRVQGEAPLRGASGRNEVLEGYDRDDDPVAQSESWKLAPGHQLVRQAP